MDEINKLPEIRREIDQIDRELLSLFEARMAQVARIAELKGLTSMEILDEAREQEVLAKTGLVKNGSLQKYAAGFLNSLVNISKEYQADTLPKRESAKGGLEEENAGLNGIAGFQGIPGSYSQQASKEYFGRDCPSRNYFSWEDVFQALENREIQYGVLPLENSFTGGIAEVYDLLCRYGFYIVGEKCLQIDHNLLGLIGSTLEDIREIYSHPQGLQQCSVFLKNNPDWNVYPCSNTAVSAKMVADSGDRSKGAIASKQSAELYNLQVLVQGINNNPQNYTRFIIIGRYPELKPENNKISIAVTIPHEPGSLHRILGYFSGKGLNMLKIESRPMPGRAWEYLFYIDFAGNLGRPEVKEVVNNIKSNCSFFQLLGNFISDT